MVREPTRNLLIWIKTAWPYYGKVAAPSAAAQAPSPIKPPARKERQRVAAATIG
jgi:hypothetical protein